MPPRTVSPSTHNPKGFVAKLNGWRGCRERRKRRDPVGEPLPPLKIFHGKSPEVQITIADFERVVVGTKRDKRQRLHFALSRTPGCPWFNSSTPLASNATNQAKRDRRQRTNPSPRCRRHGYEEPSSSLATVALVSSPYPWPRSSGRYRCRA